jgi:hypothetical protein
LETFSKISEILMGVHGIKVKILKSNIDPDAVEVLQTAWVKIFGLPSIALREPVVMKIATLAGETLLVDELSLIKTRHVRVKMNVRDPTKLRGFVTIFINKMGYEIKFVSEKYKDKTTHFQPPPLDFGGEGDGEEESDDEDSDRKHRGKVWQGSDWQRPAYWWSRGRVFSSKAYFRAQKCWGIQWALHPTESAEMILISDEVHESSPVKAWELVVC